MLFLALQKSLKLELIWRAEGQDVQIYPFVEPATGGFQKEKVFSVTWQNSQENICARVSFLIKLQA